MLAVLVLCLGGFVLTAGCHLLAIVGALPRIPTPLAWVLLIQMFAGFVLAILTHPRGQFQGGHARVSLWTCLSALSLRFRIGYAVLWAYGLVAVLASWPWELEENGRISMLEMLDVPFCFTAIVLLFSATALLVSHSAVSIYRNPFGTATP